MSAESVPLKPVGKEEIRKLETALLTMSLFSQETLQAIGNPHERLTWVDSLYVAAAAFARDKAGMTASQIAEEVGVTEATIRKHLKAETKAGQIIKNTYEKLKNEGFNLAIPECGESQQVKSLQEQLKTIQDKVSKAKELLGQAIQALS
ncbi:MAG: regulator [Nitrososphaeria archaeon]